MKPPDALHSRCMYGVHAAHPLSMPVNALSMHAPRTCTYCGVHLEVSHLLWFAPGMHTTIGVHALFGGRNSCGLHSIWSAGARPQEVQAPGNRKCNTSLLYMCTPCMHILWSASGVFTMNPFAFLLEKHILWPALHVVRTSYEVHGHTMVCTYYGSHSICSACTYSGSQLLWLALTMACTLYGVHALIILAMACAYYGSHRLLQKSYF